MPTVVVDSVIVGGKGNTISGYNGQFQFIGGGQGNYCNY